MKLLSIFLTTILLSYSSFSQNYTVSGYLKDASNGESLIGATVLLKGTSQGVITNVYGFYSISLPKGKCELEFRYIGYSTTEKSIELLSNIRLDVELGFEDATLEEVVISEEAEDANVTNLQMSVNKLEIKDLETMPMLLGEADVIRSLQTLPGVATVGEGASGFNIRGGSVGQNMILLDEAPVYNSSHLLGFFSVFNPDATKDVNLIKGGIPARYGGRISSVLDIRMKEGNSKKLSAQGGIGSIFSRLAIEAPIVKDKASFIFAARRSYIDILAKPFVEELQNGAQLNFYDLTLKTNYNINENNRIYLSGYLGRDNFKFDAQQGFNWGNKTATLRWNHIFNSRLFANFTLLTSDYDYVLAFGEEADNQFDWNSRIKNYNLKTDFTYFINNKNELQFGTDLLWGNLQPGNAVGISEGEERVISVDELNTLEASIYVSNNQKINDRLELEYGLRNSNFFLLGEGTSYEFDQTGDISQSKAVIDTTTYGKNKIITSYHNIEPRLAVKYQLNASSSAKLSYNKLSQYLHLISNTTASNPLDIWLPSSNNLRSQIGHQVAIGWFKNFGKNNDVEFSVETYYRTMKNQIDYVNGADLLLNKFVEGDILSGEGRAYGLELYAKKNKGKLNGWISYTLAKTELKINGISKNYWYPTRYDQRHNFKMTAFYDLNERWSFSSVFTFTSGVPVTFPDSKYYQQGVLAFHNSTGLRHNYRTPDYHRLDVSAVLQGKKFKKNGKPRKNENYWVFSIYNLYGRQNAFSIYFAQDDVRSSSPTTGSSGQTYSPPQPGAYQVSILGNLLPAISYNYKF